ncbi:MAG: TlpA family protein disulfide reductase [Dehalococcoidia bacterium]|nr:TlpA family protein disulfide reductase [Dehalococcoidia bacterium]MDW8119809.1 TlpA disulfide reductase family protein [Chloroflexota bacterium]
MRRRWMLAVGLLIPFLALVGVLAWGLGRSGGAPAQVAVRATLGEVVIRPRPVPDVALVTFDGRVVRLSDLRGRVVMMDFWASWCAPCRAEAPALAQAYRDLRAQGMPVEFIGVNVWDREEDARAFLERFQVPYPSGMDTHGRIALELGVTGIPEKYIVDAQGTVVKKFVGPMGEKDLLQVLEPLLKGSP